MGPILVFGHANPDNDSICSAIAYAHLKNLTDPANVYVPARLGPLPPESAWVLNRFGVEEPLLISHVRLRVSDVMTTDVQTVGPDDTLRTVGTLLSERGVRALPVVSEDGQVCGLVTVQALAARYVEDVKAAGYTRRPVRISRLVEALDGTLMAGSPEAELSGGVVIGAMEPETMLERMVQGDTVILSNRRRSQPLAIEGGAACLVITGGFDPEPGVLEAAQGAGCAVITTKHGTYAAARLMDLAHAVSEVMETDTMTVEPDMLLSEAAEDLFASPHREAPVVDGGGLVGILTRTNIARGSRRRVILVDHNEVSQSADGVEEASVIEIVDHHRIGDIQTSSPILFLGSPVGATATIVAGRYRELDVDPPTAMAGLLLAAVLTDTVLLKSPTTTDIDREIVEWLAGIVDVDPVEFALEMFRARSSSTEFSAEKIVGRDLKEYSIRDVVVAIGQVETVDLDEILDHRAEIMAHMESIAAARGYETVALMVTDVVREGTELLVAGKRRIIERAFGIDLSSGSAWFDGMMSRKKQVAPRLVDSGS